MRNCNVEDICVGEKDSQDQEILEVYGRKSPDYAVYRTAERVLVQFADEKTHNAEQRKAMAPLNPLRGEINGLIDGWRDSGSLAKHKRALRYARRGGDALIVAFEEDVAGAQALLAGIKKDILDERIAWARFEHLVCAFLMALATMWLSWAAISDIGLDEDGGFIWRAASAGALGAFFSIAIGIKGRTILPDLQRTANNLDAVLRILIGVIAAAVLTALVLTKAVVIEFGGAKLGDAETTVSKTVDKVPAAGTLPARAPEDVAPKPGASKADDAAITLRAGGHHWLYILIVGFVAGFLERLVPDLLARATTAAPPPPQTPGVGPKRPANAKEGDPKEGEAKDKGTTVAGATGAAASEADPLPGEADTDHCACDIPLTPAEVTDDVDLPPAAGGVAASSPSTGDRP